MAIYQFVIELIPEIWAKNNNYSAELLLGSEQYDLSIPWNRYKLSDDVISTISRFLPISKSWHQDLLTWGDAQCSDIQLWKQNDIVDAITIRLDLRDNKIEELVAKTVSLAIKLKCVLLLPGSKQIISSNYLLLHEAIGKSSAAQYVINPRKYLNDNVSGNKSDSFNR
jgi:hypothetical protein